MAAEQQLAGSSKRSVFIMIVRSKNNKRPTPEGISLNKDLLLRFFIKIRFG